MPSLKATPPAEAFAEAKARLAAAVDAVRDEILDLSHRIHASPEAAFQEVQAATWIAEILARHGFDVEHSAGSLTTAIRAVRRGGRAGARAEGDGAAAGSGTSGPRIGILAEYDALPGLGHGCGHYTMAAAGVGAAIALASIAAELPGEIVFLGTRPRNAGAASRS